jgi:hypothetical protein
MRWLPVYFLFLTLTGLTNAVCQTADFSKGKWLKMTTTKKAIYQVTGTQLKQMGIALPVSSAKIQLFGFDLTALTEKVPSIIPVGNKEMAILVKDGGDGNFDEKDSFLFFAPGNLRWQKLPGTEYWAHQNLSHSDTAFYFFTIGENGKRISQVNNTNVSQQKLSSYPAHFLWEQDSVNLLNSGKLWLGKPMGTGVGKTVSINYPFNAKNIIETEPILIASQYVSTNYNQSAQFDLKWNDNKIRTSSIQPVSGLVYDATANSILDSFTYWPSKSSLAQLSNNLVLQYNASSGSTGWLDYLEMHVPMQLGFADAKYFSFDGKYEAPNYQYEIADADATCIVWDISNSLNPLALSTNYDANKISFSTNTTKNQAFFALKQNAFEPLVAIDTLANQSILNTTAVDYLILAPSIFQQTASKLKNFHQQKNGYKVDLIDPVKVYNDFSGGIVNPIAIRNYLKYAQSKAKEKGYLAAQYLCIIGGADFNISRLNKNSQVPVFESAASLDILNSYASDDFYAILKDGADINFPSSVDSLEIAIGRIPAKTIAEADTMINKIIQYAANNNKGAWQNQITWVADDGDYNLHLQDAENIIAGLQKSNPIWNNKKIYLDLFPATNAAGGLSYPLVNNEIKQTINSGTLVLNYTGHGNYLRLTEEAVINEANIQAWDNAANLPLMITASCDFAPYDQPQINPIGLNALMQNNKGIVGLVAANRLVFAYSNKQINEQYIQALLVPDQNGLYYSIGKALQKAKNINWSMQGDKLNAFKFSLLGDPALGLVHAKNGIQINLQDSITAGELITIKGAIEKEKIVNAAFNGLVDCIVYDVVKEKTTLANQSSSIKTAVPTRESILYRGKATVSNGKFSLNFILPKETNSLSGNLRIQAYAYNSTEDALGIKENVYVKNANWISQTDTKGPQIIAYINDSNFTNNSWVSENAILMVRLKDSAGIQSSGNALGHDLQLIIDEDIQHPYLLNNYYIADIDTYQSGSIIYSLPNLSIGKHQLVLKAWDLLGNLTKDTLWFIVPNKDIVKAKDLVNKPNPMLNYTQFSFDLNSQDPNIETEFSLRNLNGQLLVNKILPHKNMSNKWVMDWDGRDQSGAVISPGLYLYTITVRAGSQIFVLSNKLMKL